MFRPMHEPRAEEIAQRVRAGMVARDRASRGLGFQVLDVQPGRSTVTVTVRDDMLNAHDVCHGGLIATLADSAFGFACNSYNELAVAMGFEIDIVAPARLGDVLTARCAEVSRTRRTGLYDVEITNQHGQRVALFRGRSYTIRGTPSVTD
jgi:acyl-CoA thioesterase